MTQLQKNAGLKAIFFVLVVIFTVLDQVTKSVAIIKLRGQGNRIIIPGVLELTYLENRGIAWGMLQGKRYFLLIFSVLFFFLICFSILRMPQTTYYLPLVASLSVMTAGAAGNFTDRFFRGYVVDFIYVSLIDFPVFNFADICVVSGGFLFVLLICFRYNDQDFEFLRVWRGRKKEK